MKILLILLVLIVGCTPVPSSVESNRATYPVYPVGYGQIEKVNVGGGITCYAYWTGRSSEGGAISCIKDD